MFTNQPHSVKTKQIRYQYVSIAIRFPEWMVYFGVVQGSLDGRALVSLRLWARLPIWTLFHSIEKCQLVSTHKYFVSIIIGNFRLYKQKFLNIGIKHHTVGNTSNINRIKKKVMQHVSKELISLLQKIKWPIIVREGRHHPAFSHLSSLIVVKCVFMPAEEIIIILKHVALVSF